MWSYVLDRHITVTWVKVEIADFWDEGFAGISTGFLASTFRFSEYANQKSNKNSVALSPRANYTD
jgi:hypothetical protein